MPENEQITTAELAQIVKISSRKIKENTKRLKEMGLIERMGTAKKGRWKITL